MVNSKESIGSSAERKKIDNFLVRDLELERAGQRYLMRFGGSREMVRRAMWCFLCRKNGTQSVRQGPVDERNLPASWAETIDAALENLKSWGFIDDRAFAESWLRRGRRKGLSRNGITFALRERGVSPGVISEVLVLEGAQEPAGLPADLISMELGRDPDFDEGSPASDVDASKTFESYGDVAEWEAALRFLRRRRTYANLGRDSDTTDQARDDTDSQMNRNEEERRKQTNRQRKNDIAALARRGFSVELAFRAWDRMNRPDKP